MADVLTVFTDTVVKAYGPNLRSLILYGSMAAGAEAGKGSDYNLLIILNDVGPRDSGALEKGMKAWMKAGNNPPLLFSRAMFDASADVFPIEFLDMKEAHKVLAGVDPFIGLEILDRNLRHECEYELKSKLLKLRQGYMACRGDKRQIERLMTGSISSVMTVFRHIVRLSGAVPSPRKRDALEVLAKTAGVKTAVFETLLRIKHGEEKARTSGTDALMGEYLGEIEKIAALVDGMGVKANR